LLLNLPDISKWNTGNIKSISKIFENCISLKSLPDISKWKTDKIINI
jgi:surface protein